MSMEQTAPGKENAEMKLVLKNVSKGWEGRGILKECSYVFSAGCTYYIRGRSGAGKTTLLHIIAGYLPFHGQVLIPKHARIGYMMQEDLLFSSLTLRQNLRLAAAGAGHWKKGEGHALAWLEMMQIDHLMDREIRCLSGGERKRAALACAAVGRPDFLLLDEPVVALDGESRKGMLRCMRFLKKKIGCITVTHETIRDPTSIHLRLEKGKLFDDSEA